jgi:hypothetical protein
MCKKRSKFSGGLGLVPRLFLGLTGKADWSNSRLDEGIGAMPTEQAKRPVLLHYSVERGHALT